MLTKVILRYTLEVGFSEFRTSHVTSNAPLSQNIRSENRRNLDNPYNSIIFGIILKNKQLDLMLNVTTTTNLGQIINS